MNSKHSECKSHRCIQRGKMITYVHLELRQIYRSFEIVLGGNSTVMITHDHYFLPAENKLSHRWWRAQQSRNIAASTNSTHECQTLRFDASSSINVKYSDYGPILHQNRCCRKSTR